MTTISTATTDDLLAELARRKASAKTLAATQAGSAGAAKVSPVGLWHVTTEGDCEGRTVRDLGYHRGHVADIAIQLSALSYYGLRFSPAEPVSPATPPPPRDEVSVSVDLSNGAFSGMSPDEQVAYMRAYLADQPSAGSYQVEASTYYASVTIKRTP